eukprot:2888844-Prymnesium_polylepis.1
MACPPSRCQARRSTPAASAPASACASGQPCCVSGRSSHASSCATTPPRRARPPSTCSPTSARRT